MDEANRKLLEATGQQMGRILFPEDRMQQAAVEAICETHNLRGELKRLQQKYDEAHGLLCEAHEFLEGYADVKDGDDGRPEPNRAMALQQQIDWHLNGRPY